MTAIQTSVVLVEPQRCFAAALVEMFRVYAADVAVLAFGSFADAAPAIADADIVVVDVDPDRLDPIAALDRVSFHGGIATVVLTLRAFALRDADVPPALLGIVSKKTAPHDLVTTVLGAARSASRIGLRPDDWNDRRSVDGALSFIGRDRRRRDAVN